MFEKVLIATDLTEGTQEMADAFYSICPDLKTQAYLLHVVKDAADAAEGSSYFKKSQSRLKSFSQAIERAGYETPQILWKEGRDVLHTIMECVEEYGIDLMILLSHGKGLWESAFSGSTTFNAMRAVEIPTLIVKTEKPEKDCLRRVLVPTDFSRRSLVALYFLRDARDCVGEVIFLHVIEKSRSEDQLRESRAVAEEQLVELKNEMKSFGIPCRYILSDGSAASKEICRVAEDEDCSLIFASKTGAGPIKGLLIGSTAQNVALNARRNLLIMPEDDSDDE